MTLMKKRQIFASLLAVVLLGCSDDSKSPTAPSSVTPATAVSNVSNSTSGDSTLPASDVTHNIGQLPIRTADESSAASLTANVLHPGEHDGSPFTVELIFSEPIVTKPQYIARSRSGSFRVSEGRITRAARQDRERRSDGRRGWVTSHWQLTVEPSGEGDVRLRSRANERTTCAGSSALCTQDRRLLSHALDFTIRGPETAQANVPARVPPGPVPNLTVTSRGGDEYSIRWEEATNTVDYHVWVSAYHTQIPRCTTGPTTGPRQTGPFPSLSSNGVTRYFLSIAAGRGGADPEDWPVFSVQGVREGRLLPTIKGPCTSANVYGPVSSEPNYTVQ